MPLYNYTSMQFQTSFPLMLCFPSLESMHPQWLLMQTEYIDNLYPLNWDFHFHYILFTTFIPIKITWLPSLLPSVNVWLMIDLFHLLWFSSLNYLLIGNYSLYWWQFLLYPLLIPILWFLSLSMFWLSLLLHLITCLQ